MNVLETLSFTPTQEQKDIWEAISNTEDTYNIVIDAKAGSGKTKTIEIASSLLPKTSKKIFLAFNKHIVNELRTRLDNDIFVSTFHSLGWSSIRKKHKDAVVDENKAYKVIRKKATKWAISSKVNTGDYINDIKKMVDLCRLTLTFTPSKILDLAIKYDIPINEVDVKRILNVMETMLNDKSAFDFTDMVYLPATDNRYFIFQYDVVFVDEAQDLSRAQQKIMRRLVKPNGGRFIAVGDPNQSIYSFAGSDNYSFSNLSKIENTKVFPLSYSFRCSKEVIRLAQKIVPDIKYSENAIEGLVENGDVINDSREGDFIICRKNAPLVKLFLEMLLLGKKVSMMGDDYKNELLGKVNEYMNKSISQMIYDMEKDLKEYGKQITLITGIDNPTEHGGYIAAKDKLEVMKILSEHASDNQSLEWLINKIFSPTGKGIVFTTVHKSKGLETDRVFIICPNLLPLGTSQPWMYQQEKNLEYVAYTRAKEAIFFDHKWGEEFFKSKRKVRNNKEQPELI